MVIYIYSQNSFGQFTSPYHCKKWARNLIELSEGWYCTAARSVAMLWFCASYLEWLQNPDAHKNKSNQEQKLAFVNPAQSAFTTPDVWLYSHWRNGKRTLSWALSQGGVGISDMCCAGLLIPSCLSLPSPSFMSLDQNLFTLQFVPHKQYNNVIDLLDSSGNLHYRKQRITSPEYKIEVYGNSHYSYQSIVLTQSKHKDPLSESLLVTATAPSATSKTKILELKNPTQIVELKYTGTISFRWNFKWEESVLSPFGLGHRYMYVINWNHQAWVRVEARRMFHTSKTWPSCSCRSDKGTQWQTENFNCPDTRL